MARGPSIKLELICRGNILGEPPAPHDSLTYAQQLLDQGFPFHAHDVLEAAWKTSMETDFAKKIKEYFDFLEKHPEVIPWLSLGPDVDVIHQGKVIRCRR